MRALMTFAIIVLPLLLVNCQIAFAETGFDARTGDCTIGVFSGSATSDGRPILWKNRDVPNTNQRFIYVASYSRDGITTIPYTGNVYSSDSSKVYMGANFAGFGIMNSDSYNLGDSLDEGIDDGTLMRIALETCAGIEQFELLLDSTNIAGRKNCWNFGVLDSSGSSALYECANHSYNKFEPYINEPSGWGYIIRANFSLSGGNQQTGFDRYKRAIELTENCLSTGHINESYILSEISRDLANEYDNPYPLPYFRSQAGGAEGYIFNYGCTISNNTTSSAAVIKGVASGEDPRLTMIFALLGPPDLSLAFPLWVGAETVPIYLSRVNDNPMVSICDSRRSRIYDNPNNLFYINSKALCDEFGEGIYSYTLPLENWGIAQANELLEYWRINPPQNSEIAFEQFSISLALFGGFQLESAEYLTDVFENREILPGDFKVTNYPNPFNGFTRIEYNLPEIYKNADLKIYDSLGRLVKVLDGTDFARNYVIWKGDNSRGSAAASGIYYYSLQAGAHLLRNKMVLIK